MDKARDCELGGGNDQDGLFIARNLEPGQGGAASCPNLGFNLGQEQLGVEPGEPLDRPEFVGQLVYQSGAGARGANPWQSSLA